MHDVIVIGAGPGGSTTAHYLAQAGLDVLLLDKADFPREKTCGDALTPRAVAALDHLGLLPTLNRAAQRVARIDVVAPNGMQTTSELATQVDRPGYAMVVPRLVLDATIYERAVASGARFQGKTHVTSIEQTHSGVVVRARQAGGMVSFEGRLAVIATGASPRLLLQAGLLKQVPLTIVAARAYFEDISALRQHLRFHFNGVPLPGYGWVFPLSQSSANIGFGTLRAASNGDGRSGKPADFAHFISAPHMQRLLGGARQVGPVKSYPLRTDFATAPTVGKRVLAVGEAAGLVNPVTGEGIDYALESGKLAAEHLIDMFRSGDLSQATLQHYDTVLRHHFQALFIYCQRRQRLIGSRWVLNQLIRAVDRRDEYRQKLVNILLGQVEVSMDASQKPLWKTIVSAAAAGLR
jgi:geranylgeranyl reductase family protein